MPDCRNLQTLDRRGEVEEDEKKVMGQRRRGRGEGIGVGIRSIRVFRFGLFGFCEFRVSKNENRNFKDKIRNRTRIDRIFRFGLFGPPN